MVQPAVPVGTAVIWGPVQVPLSRLLAVGVVVLASLLAAAAIVTVGYSVRAARRRRRRDPLRATLRSELLDRLYGRDEPAWDAWVAGLSATERDELESLLDVYLRELDGRDAETLVGLGRALGIPERARREIVNGGYRARSRALVWLALLRDVPDRDLLRTHCTGTPRERAAAARVLYAARTDDCGTTGVDLLLRDNPEPFSVFGVDTLYCIAERDPGPFFERAAADFATWPPALKRQALLVVRHLTTVVGGADLLWVVTALSSAEPAVRAAAWRALGAYGWNRRLRDAIDLDAIPNEPVPAVRADAYRALGVWGDAAATAAIDAAGSVDPSPRARVAAAETLAAQRASTVAPAPNELPDGSDHAVDRPFDVARAWAAEHARFDRLVRDISRDRDRLQEEIRG